ncbi:MAG TPA: LamG-like jellyroll fold domain-containing protein [Flavipsychrobacter sp.]|nr:LamG-like jellyroll fold domain-containing protein [Flavipsychrobacter sp.]
MKKIITTLLMSIIYIFATAQIPTSGLLIHFPFTGNANDASGKAHHGNIKDVKPVKGKIGYPATAYLFDTISSSIGVPYKPDMNVNKISMCAVFKANKFYTDVCQGNFIISRGTQGTNGSLILDYLDNGYNDCTVADTNLYVFAGQVGPIVLSATTTQCSVKVRTQTWYCYILTFDGDTARHYVNGTLINKFAGWSNTIGSSTDSICIGKYPWGGSSFPYNFIGVLDDIAIYNRVLSDSEINNYCTNAPMIGVEDTTTSISQSNIINQANLQIYPNPSDGIFTVSGTSASAIVALQVYNAVGMLVYNTSAFTNNKHINTTIDIRSLPSGVYTMKLSDDKHIQTVRLLKN